MTVPKFEWAKLPRAGDELRYLARLTIGDMVWQREEYLSARIIELDGRMQPGYRSDKERELCLKAHSEIHAEALHEICQLGLVDISTLNDIAKDRAKAYVAHLYGNTSEK